MTELRFDLQALEVMGLFERMTRVPAEDFVETSRTAYFVVPKGSLRRLQDNPGMDRLAKRMGKTVRLVERRKEPEAFLRQLFWHYGVDSVSVDRTDEGLQARVRVSPLMKGRAIGRGGENLKALRELARRHVAVEGVVLE